MGNRREYNGDARRLRFDIVNGEFENQLPNHKVYRTAFEAAQEKVGIFYSSYESFKTQRTIRMKHK